MFIVYKPFQKVKFYCEFYCDVNSYTNSNTQNNSFDFKALY